MIAENKAIVLGIDPGSRYTGFGIIAVTGNQYHFIHADRIKTTGTDVAPRLRQIYAGLREVILQFQPQEVAIEKIFMHINPSSALLLGQARGAALVAVGADHSLSEYTARQIKQAVVGYGNADKAQVQMMVKQILSLQQNFTSDAADALAIAICHANCRTGIASYFPELRGMRRGRAR